MNTRIISSGDRYGFAIIDDNPSKVVYVSTLHYFLTPSVKSSYEQPFQARSASYRFINNRSYHIDALRKKATEDMTKPIAVDISAEKMLEDHYMEIYNGVKGKARSSKKSSDENREKVYNEIKIIVGELENITQNIKDLKSKRKIKRILMLYKQLIRKHFDDFAKKASEQEDAMPPASQMSPLPPMSPMSPMSPITASIINMESSDLFKLIDVNIKEEILGDYAEKACDAISKKHKDLDYVIDCPSLDNITIFSSGEPILNIRVNSKLNVSGIFPTGELYGMYPFHSVEFYQRYWKPIVETIKHFYLTDASLLLCPERNPLPNIPKEEKKYALEGWDVENNRLSKVDVSFKGDRLTWMFEPSESTDLTLTASNYVSKYTEQDYINTPIVKCIDPNLKSIYGRTGTVVQVIPYVDHMEIDVDFGRGLDIVRLTEEKLEIVPVDV